MMKDFLSVVIVSYNNSRELPRTLWSLSPHFQKGVSADDYEVIVVDNGSKKAPKAADFADYGLDLTIVKMENPTHSPVRAVNRGLDMACGAAMGVMIDGARMVSPGLMRRTREALALDERAVVGARGRYLGPMMQRFSMRYGYNQQIEDQLLESIDWKNNGYDLFSISMFDEPSRPTWMGQIGETNALFMRRALWKEMGGLDERFETPGGGFVNLDTWERACALPHVKPIILLGEATFHQFHGGVATNKPKSAVDPLREEYVRLHGRDHKKSTVAVSHWGSIVAPALLDELYWEPGMPAIDRLADGPMKGLLDTSTKPLRVDAAGNVVATKSADGKGGSKKGGAKAAGERKGVRATKALKPPPPPPPTGLKKVKRAISRRLPTGFKTRVKRLLGR